MSVQPSSRGLSLALVLTFALGTLTGCQSLQGNPNNNNNNGGTGVAVGNASLNFGNVAVGNSKALQDTLSNGASASVTVNSVSGLTPDFQLSGITFPLVLAQGQSTQFSVAFQPSQIGRPLATLNFMGDAGQNYAAVQVAGNAVAAGQLALNPASLTFSNVKVGKNQSSTVALSNSGGTDLTINSATLTGSGFTMSNLALPLTLAAGQSTNMTVTFTPGNPGNFSGSIAFGTVAAPGAKRKKTFGVNQINNAVTLPLNGAAVAAGTLAASPASLAFGTVQVGKSSSLSETLTNTGGSTATITQANVTGTGLSVSGLTLPTSLAPNQSVTFTVTFAPSAAGSVSGTLAIVSDASNSPLNVALSATGAAAGQLGANPSSLSFGNVQVGKNATLSETLTNSGGTAVTITQANVTGTGFSISGLSLPVTLNPSQSVTFSATFAPTAAGAASGTLAILSNAPNSPLNIPLSGTGVTAGMLAANPASLAFGSVQVGKTSSLSETLSNTGGSTVQITQANITGTGFSVTGLTLPANLSPNQSVTFTATFAPSATGSVSGTLAIVSNASNSPLNIALSGTGVAAGSLTANPSSVNFGNVTVGSSQTTPITVTNTGGSSVNITSAAASGTGFSFTGPNLPVTLGAGQSTTFNATFSPAAAGSSSGSLTINSNAANPTLTIALTGTGVAQGQLAPNPASLSFGNVQTGTSKTLSETLTNSGGSNLTISAATATGTGYSLSGLTLPLTLNAGQSTTFNVTFAPNAAGSVSGNVAITSNGANPNLNIALSGTGVAPGTLSANPTSLSFGSVQVGQSANLSETLTNTGGSAVTISQANVTGTGFSISGLTLPLTLNPSQSVTFTATFAPAAAGSASGTLAIVSNASNSPLNIAMSGTGTTPGQLAVSPASLSFGNVVVGASSSLGGTLTASGASVTVSSASINSNEFVLSGITLPKTLASGQSATFTVTFTPGATGAANAMLTFSSNATNAPTQQSLSGNGTAPPQHSVDLTWSASAGAVGYNVYRSSTQGSGYVMINTSLDGNAAYTDNTVSGNQTYYYVVTAVDANNLESVYSNEAAVPVPGP